MKSVWIKSQIL